MRYYDALVILNWDMARFYWRHVYCSLIIGQRLIYLVISLLCNTEYCLGLFHSMPCQFSIEFAALFSQNIVEKIFYYYRHIADASLQVCMPFTPFLYGMPTQLHAHRICWAPHHGIISFQFAFILFRRLVIFCSKMSRNLLNSQATAPDLNCGISTALVHYR